MTSTVRADIAAALSTVSGITGSAYQPAFIGAGSAWCHMVRGDRGPGLSFEKTWAVVVVLGGDAPSVDAVTDDLIPLLVDALEPIVFVDSFEPAAISTGGGDLYGLRLLCRKE